MGRSTALIITVGIAAATLGIAAAVALGAPIARSAAATPVAAPLSRTYELPRTRVLTIGTATVRLDTETGRVAILRGGGGVTGSGESWARRVPAVTGNHSGALDVVRLDPSSFDGVYLVDVDGTRTWLLKWRGNENGQWREVREIR